MSPSTSRFSLRKGSGTKSHSRTERLRRLFHGKSGDSSRPVSSTATRPADTDVQDTAAGNDEGAASTADTLTAQTRNRQPDSGDVIRPRSRRSEQQDVVAADRRGDRVVGQRSSELDIWSAAYREAVESMEDDVNMAALEGRAVSDLFEELGDVDSENTQKATFWKGWAYLHKAQVPLERLKLALDIASPFGHLEPTATVVIGVLKGVTAVAISVASADLEIAKKIGEMLEQISYIDDCDTLGQKAQREDIHKALVNVYRKIIEFHGAAYGMLTKKGAKLVAQLLVENSRLPELLEDFLKYASILQAIVSKATLDVVNDIRTMLYDQEIARWLGAHKLHRQSRLEAELRQLRTDEACKFILSDPKFQTWYTSITPRQLVILGNVGRGKTVTMAFLIDELRRRSRYQLPQPKVCFHFCRDDETGQASHIYAVLILELLEQLTGLKKPFYEWYKSRQQSGVFDPTADGSVLEGFFVDVLKTLDRPLYVVVDGLDECESASRITIVNMLKKLSKHSMKLKTIVSCRPEEEILKSLKDDICITLEPDADRDIVIVEHIVKSRLSHLEDEVKTLIIKSLSHLAQGTAVWTRMVIELIRVRKIKAMGPMRSFLAKMPLPNELSQLYLNLMSKCASDDPENEALAWASLKVLAAAHRPLSILELAWAATLALSEPGTSSTRHLGEQVDHQRVMGLIYPFIANADFEDTGSRQLRLVHQSVKEFIVQYLSTAAPDSPTRTGLVASHGRTGALDVEALESFILGICMRYLMLEEIGTVSLFSDDQIAIDELPQEADLFGINDSSGYDVTCTWEEWEEPMIRFDPAERGFGEFFVYASCLWVTHLAAVNNEPLPKLSDMEDICKAGSLRLSNWTQQNRRPDCVLQARFIFESSIYDPLSIVSLYGSRAVLLNMLSTADFTSNVYQKHKAMRAAEEMLRWGDLGKVEILFTDSKQAKELQNLYFFELVLDCWSNPGASSGNWDAVFALVNHVQETLAVKGWANDLVCLAAAKGCLPLVRRVVKLAEHDERIKAGLNLSSEAYSRIPSEPAHKHQFLGEAVSKGKVEVAAFLLEQPGIEYHLLHRDSHSRNVLHMAAPKSDPRIFSPLVERFPQGILQQDDQSETPLNLILHSPASPEDRYECAKILLKQAAAKGYSLTRHDENDSLRTAVRLGDEEMCSLFVHTGRLDASQALETSPGSSSRLKDEVSYGAEKISAILKLLCDDAQDVAISK